MAAVVEIIGPEFAGNARASRQLSHPMPHLITAALPAFLASLVEFVEATTIVLAVGVTRGWRSALLGAAAAVVALAVAVALFGPALGRVPLNVLQAVVGVLLLFFGLRWLRKAVLRYAGTIALHDEAAIYDRRRSALADRTAYDVDRIDAVGLVTSFKAVALEGLEVVFIVIAVGATAGALIPASLGATLAAIVVIVAGIALRAPLARVPENTLKFAVGVMLSAFGTFWTGEGIGAAWPGEDLSLVGLIAGFALAATLGYAYARRLHAV